MDRPETRYVTVGGGQVAYQVAGTGSEDFIYCLSLGLQIDALWQTTGGEFLNSLLERYRVIVFDRRGSGASDPVPLNDIPTWEDLVDDLKAVLDDVGSEQAVVMAVMDTGPIAIMFAAMHPERVSHLILESTTARFLEADDYPIGVSAEVADGLVAATAAGWGTEAFARMMLPSYADDPEMIAAWARMMRASATPKSAAAQADYINRHVDVREFLSLVQAPTLVCHPMDSPLIPVAQGRYLAEHIANSRLLEWPGSDMSPPDQDAGTSGVIEFLTGERPAALGRILATVLFTDIVGSTELAASSGDQRWHALLDAHDRVVRDALRRFRGREIKTTGDGFLAAFDGPARAIRCAQIINAGVKTLGIQLRIGLHTGECEVRGQDLAGLAVHIAARIGTLATGKEILVSSTMHDLVIGSGITFIERGEHELKGVPGSWKLFAVGA